MAWALREAARLGADPKRVFVMGHSAGGYNAAMMAVDARWLTAEGVKPQQLAGWIGLAGAYEFLPIENPEVRPVFVHAGSCDRVILSLREREGKKKVARSKPRATGCMSRGPNGPP